MAEAVCADIDRYGADQVAALVVSHSDAEDLADRIRARLAASGMLAGPAMTGPGMDRRAGLPGGGSGAAARPLRPRRAARWSTAPPPRSPASTPTVSPSPSTQRGRQRCCRRTFVPGTRKDGSPNLSHAWARTVDGAQGGTWEACHLLGSAALDAYRGYTGQSRSRQPTHTWNTTRVGRRRPRRHPRRPARRAPNKSPTPWPASPIPALAARSDPWTLDRQLRQQIAEHERVLAGRPRRPPGGAGCRGRRGRSGAQAWLANMDAIAGHTARQLDELGASPG